MAKKTTTRRPRWADKALIRMEELEVVQQDLVSLLGVKTRGAVGHYFAGRRQLTSSQAVALARRLRMSLDELFFDEMRVSPLANSGRLLPEATIDELIDQLATKISATNPGEIRAEQVFVLEAVVEGLEQTVKSKYRVASENDKK